MNRRRITREELIKALLKGDEFDADYGIFSAEGDFDEDVEDLLDLVEELEEDEDEETGLVPFEAATGFVPAAGSVVSYSVKLTNTDGANDYQVYVFGYNKFFNANNFGNPAAVTIQSARAGTTYAQILAETQFPMRVVQMRIDATNGLQSEQPITVVSSSGSGVLSQFVLDPAEYKGLRQFDTDSIIMPLEKTGKAFTLSGNVYLTFWLLASQGVRLTIWGKRKF